MDVRRKDNRRGFLGRVAAAFGGLLAAPVAGLGRAARADDTTLWRRLYALRARGYGVGGCGLPGFIWTSTLRRKLKHDTTFRWRFYATFGAPGAPVAAPLPPAGGASGYRYEYGREYGYSGYRQAAPVVPEGYPPAGYGYGAPAYGAPRYEVPAYGQPTYVPPTYAPPSYAPPASAAPVRTPAPGYPAVGTPLPGTGDVELPPPLPTPYSPPVSRRGRLMTDVLRLLES